MTRFERGILAVAMILLAVLGVGLLAAAPGASDGTPSETPSSPPGDALREGVVGRIATLDPLYATDPAERDAIALIFRGLTRLGPDGSIVPDLAASWELAANGRSWTFRLRDDVRWEDGRPVTADDVAFTVLTLQHPDYDGPFGGPWRGVVVDRLDRLTVRFRLSEPLASFLVATTQPIVPAHLLATIPVAERRRTAFGLEPVGSGPFRLVALDDVVARFERSGPAPGGGTPSLPDDPLATLPPPTPAATPPGPPRPLLGAIELRLYETAEEAAAAFRAGQVDAVGGLPAQLSADLATVPGVRRVVYPTTTVTAVVFNLRPASSPFRDARVRRAILEAIDRPAIVARVLDRAGTISDVPVPPSSTLADRTREQRDHDLAAAAKLLEAAGWRRTGDGWTLPRAEAPVAFTVDTLDEATNPGLHAVAERVVADWAALGLPATLESFGAAELVEGRLLPHEFEVAIIEINLGHDPDLFPVLASSQAAKGGSNIAGYQSLKLDALLRAARLPADLETRRARFAALSALLSEELPFLTLHFGQRIEWVRERVAGPAPRELAAGSDRFWDVLTWRLAGAPDP